MENNFEYASFKDRFFAMFIDIIILTLISFVTKGLIDLFAGYASLKIQPGILEYLSGLLGSVYYIIMLYFYQASWGMMIMKIRVVSESGNRILFIQSLLREIIGKPACVLTLGYGYFWIIADKKSQGFHDKIARTIVIYDR